jgi:hypothetical protein
MLLTTSSAGAIVHSVLLTKFAVTGCYQVRPGVFKKNISTQQSSWMVLEGGGSMVVALEDGGAAAGLEGGVGQWFKIAAAALGSSGGRRTCDNGIGISIAEAEGLLLQRWHQNWRGQGERTPPIQGAYIDSNGKEIGVFQQRWQWCKCKDGAAKARARG